MENRENISNRKKVRFFEYPRKCCGYLGFYSDQNPLHVRLVLGFLLLWLNVAFNLLFLFYEANTFWDYTHSVFNSLTGVVVAVLFTIYFVKKAEVLGTMDIFEEIFQNSE